MERQSLAHKTEEKGQAVRSFIVVVSNEEKTGGWEVHLNSVKGDFEITMSRWRGEKSLGDNGLALGVTIPLKGGLTAQIYSQGGDSGGRMPTMDKEPQSDLKMVLGGGTIQTSGGSKKEGIIYSGSS